MRTSIVWGFRTWHPKLGLSGMWIICSKGNWELTGSREISALLLCCLELFKLGAWLMLRAITRSDFLPIFMEGEINNYWTCLSLQWLSEASRCITSPLAQNALYTSTPFLPNLLRKWGFRLFHVCRVPIHQIYNQIWLLSLVNLAHVYLLDQLKNPWRYKEVSPHPHL